MIWNTPRELRNRSLHLGTLHVYYMPISTLHNPILREFVGKIHDPILDPWQCLYISLKSNISASKQDKQSKNISMELKYSSFYRYLGRLSINSHRNGVRKDLDKEQWTALLSSKWSFHCEMYKTCIQGRLEMQNDSRNILLCDMCICTLGVSAFMVNMDILCFFQACKMAKVAEFREFHLFLQTFDTLCHFLKTSGVPF